MLRFSRSQARGRNRNYGQNINGTFLSVMIFQENSRSFRLDNAISLYLFILVDFDGLVWYKGQNCLILLRWELKKKWLRPSLYLSCSKDYSANPKMVVMATNS